MTNVDQAAAETKPEAATEEVSLEKIVQTGLSQALIGLWPCLATFSQALKLAKTNNLAAHVTIVFQPNGAIMIAEPQVVRLPDPVPAAEAAPETAMDTPAAEPAEAAAEAVAQESAVDG